MAISYKALWQEAMQENKRLRALIAASPDERLRELERTRHIVDLAGIARHMHVERYTPQQWKQRNLLPPVDFPHIREPLWYAATIRDGFAVPSRRLWCDTGSARCAEGTTPAHETPTAA